MSTEESRDLASDTGKVHSCVLCQHPDVIVRTEVMSRCYQRHSRTGSLMDAHRIRR